MAAHGGPNIETDGITLCVDASNPNSYPGTGTKWYDLSGNQYHGNGVNGPTFNSDHVSFDGTDDFFWLEGINYGGGGATISEMSIFVWMRTNVSGVSLTDNWAFLDFDRSEVFNFYLGGNGRIYMSGRSSNNGGFSQYYDIFGNNTYNDGEWHHIGWTFSVANQKIVMYGDGEIDRVFDTNGSMTALGSGSNRYAFIGDGSEATSENGSKNNIHYQGDIGALHFYDSVALTAKQVKEKYVSKRKRYGI